MKTKEGFVKESKAETFMDEGGSRHIRGYGALWYNGTPETEYEIPGVLITRFMPGIFSGMDIFSADVRSYFNHDPNHILGRSTAGTLNLRTDEVGLYYDITLPDTQTARDLAVSIDRGDIRGASVTISVQSDGEIRRKEGKVFIREIKQADLYEVGPVTDPAFTNTSAHIYSGLSIEVKEFIAAAQSEEAAAASAAQAAYRARRIDIFSRELKTS
jgi:hypothetical protein